MDCTESPRTVVLYDGVCNFCHGTVQFILRWESAPNIYFASLQSDIGRGYLKSHGLPSDQQDTLVLFEDGELYFRSTAALKLTGYLRGPWCLGQTFLFLPPFIRDGLYNLIAKNRYRWFGKKGRCELPALEQRDRFLDAQ
ncbi:MAG: DCC1-like thiol-disulfide oxidoreductase family protein [Myxococcota bacterium]|nr:DCC1-like thiol-disulfide oxidoreductase family protein [Myxococcota bacterium]